jgi:hypothetical protein
MTKEILVINPRRKKPARRRKKVTSRKRATKKLSARSKRRTARKPVRRRKARTTGGLKMAVKRRKRRKSPTRRAVRRSVSRRVVRRNPSTRARAGARRAKGALQNLLTVKTVIDSAKATGGMLSAQFFAKKFGGTGLNDSDANWKDYAWGSVGALGAGLASEMIKKGSGKEFFKGGMSLIMYKMVVNELSQKSEFVDQYFGEDNLDVFLGTDGQTYSPGDSYLGDDGEVYLMGANGQWQSSYPSSDYYGPETSLGSGLTPPGSLGESVAMPTSFGEDPYQKVLG